ncbi:secreted RxLR effector protein 161-like [Telopea speciosissima]|uniref:secreted RxLR effector protein 161-like n=1 Tax=Telopea speciosissima TaxID=54955 RepID=UPI001CC4CCC6|nr:secreted RxLR effector protein 161-like [Telopea speciosissima]
MKNSKKGNVPFRHGISLSKSQCPKTPEDIEEMRRVPYASAVGSLMYAMLCTRPDICYVVGIVSRFQSNLGKEHWTTIKNILKYLRKTKDCFLVYESDELLVVGYTESDFQTDKDDRKSTSDYCRSIQYWVIMEFNDFADPYNAFIDGKNETGSSNVLNDEYFIDSENTVNAVGHDVSRDDDDD